MPFKKSFLTHISKNNPSIRKILFLWDTFIIIDLSHRKRQGMTINAITALAMGKKLITTNKKDYK
ncbi:MAG: hypothetical protein J1E57_06100 [Prevotella sp.]|nr:hypothetical protein [Prevotella sp.]